MKDAPFQRNHGAHVPLLLAPAKINLTLEVLGRRADGYHGIRSVMVPVGIFDRIAVEPAAENHVAWETGDAPPDDLVARALRAAACAPVEAVVGKAIPLGGGLGGGSSDAAAVLRAAMDGVLRRERDDAPDWLALARGLGSDVPFFLLGTGALVEATGERVTALGALPPWWAVVVRPHASVATADAYALVDASRVDATRDRRSRSDSVSLRMVEAVQRGDFAGAVALASNDFHEPVLGAYPDVARAYEALVAAGGTAALLSGSGACLFCLFAAQDEALAVAARVAGPAVAAVWMAPLVADARWRTAAVTP
jgi:4-diphosphocytidyl-2-C-methyl-D-erythritol kinase